MKFAAQLEICNRIKSIRLQLNYTQEYVAHNLNLTPSAYAKLERCESAITVVRIHELAKVFNVPYTELLCLPELTEALKSRETIGQLQEQLTRANAVIDKLTGK